MPDNLTVLINLILAAAPCLIMATCFAGLFVLMGVLLYFFIRSSSAVSSKVSQDLKQPSEQFLEEATTRLLPWDTCALSDLSAYLDYSSRAGLGRLHARGKILSLEKPEATGWLAFEIKLQKLKGGMMLKSSTHSWQLHFLGVTSRETPVDMDGTAMGIIHDKVEEIQLLSPEKHPVGLYRQHKLLGGHGGLTNWAQTPYFGGVELNGRYLGELNRNPIVLKPLVGEAKAPPLIRDLAAGFNAEEEAWLVALVGWEILYRLVTRTR